MVLRFIQTILLLAHVIGGACVPSIRDDTTCLTDESECLGCSLEISGRLFFNFEILRDFQWPVS